MRKMFILFLTAMLCLASFTSAFAATADSEGYYRADYTIEADKHGYGPSAIYAYRNGHSRKYHAMYDLQECVYSGSSANSVTVYIWNRKLGKVVSDDPIAECGTKTEIMYYTVPASNEQCKPVTYKIDSSHYSESVTIKARFLP